jgi:hypothetical protein
LLGWSFRSIRLRSWDPSGGCCSSWVGENRSKGPTGWNSTDKDFTGGSQQSLQVRLGNIIIYIYDRETFRYHFVPVNSDKF